MESEDQELELKMGRLLQTGVLLAGLAMAVGGGLYLRRHGGETASYAHFHVLEADLLNLRGVLKGVRELRGTAVIQFGVLLMIATPVLRVAFAVFGFAKERDWLYTGVSLVVLALLGYALLGAG